MQQMGEGSKQEVEDTHYLEVDKHYLEVDKRYLEVVDTHWLVVVDMQPQVDSQDMKMAVDMEGIHLAAHMKQQLVSGLNREEQREPNALYLYPHLHSAR